MLLKFTNRLVIDGIEDVAIKLVCDVSLEVLDISQGKVEVDNVLLDVVGIVIL